VDVAKKAISALNSNMIPIICVGEKRRTGIADAKKTVIKQMNDSLVDISKSKAEKIILAYEPIWAISSTAGSRHTKLADVEPVMLAMGKRFEELFKAKARILYGGSVDPGNIKTYIDSPSTQGVLIGGASISPQKVSKMIELTLIK
jgi:triosephosphate isomerase